MPRISPTKLRMSRDFASMSFRHLNGIGAIFRAIPSKAMSLDELNMPAVVRNLCRHTQGMILVTGKDRLRKVNNAGSDDR